MHAPLFDLRLIFSSEPGKRSRSQLCAVTRVYFIDNGYEMIYCRYFHQANGKVFCWSTFEARTIES